jgi:hypothetical protein
MDNTGQCNGMTFEEASKRFMDIFDEPGSIVQPVGVKLILKGREIPEGTKGRTAFRNAEVHGHDGDDRIAGRLYKWSCLWMQSKR